MLIDTVEQYCKEQGLWRNDAYPIEYSSTLELDMGSVEPSLAGPKRPQDRIALSAVKTVTTGTQRKHYFFCLPLCLCVPVVKNPC